MRDLLSTWQVLEVPAVPQTWTATQISGVARIARLADGGAALLVRRDDDGDAEDRFRLRTAHVEFVPSRKLTIRTDEGSESGSYVVLSCTGGDDGLVRQFLRIVQILPLDAAPAIIADAAVEVFELFRTLQRRGSQSIQGLWAELFLVVRSADPSLFVAAWHSDSMEVHDFVAGDARLEVKSSTRQLREHEFSLQQVETSPEKTTIASLLLEAEPTGVSVFDMREELLGRLNGFELRHRAARIVASAIGDDWAQADELRFSPEAALTSLRLYQATSVPRPPGPMPTAVKSVSFRVDLSGVEAIVDRSNQLLSALPLL